MAVGKDQWDVTDAAEWARILGLVPVPLFGHGHEKVASANLGSVLLDGQRSSFTFLPALDSRDLLTEKPLEWTWSAFLNHTVIADPEKGLLLLRRWDAPDTIRRFRLPATPRAISQFFDIVRDDKPVNRADVILHLLRAFRAIRDTVRDGDNGLESVRLFNALILAAKAVADQTLERGAASTSPTIGDVLKQLEQLPASYHSLFEASGAAELSERTKAIPASILVARFLDVEPQFHYTLEPNLLMRHASGQLYQEAHLALDRPSAQPSLFPGLDEASTAASPPARSDVRFTPVALARTLVQQALDACKDLLKRPAIDILDPACGSAVFLIQVIQELDNRGYRGKVTIRGFDLSAISCVMARFCLDHCCQDARASGMDVSYRIETADALEQNWGRPDVVLMNPPFIHLDRMSDAERDIVKQVLGNLLRGRAEKAMAFAWKAFESIAPGGVVATVLPAPLLETTTGEAWRQALADQAEFTLLGCFRGFGYFKGAKVEPAFLIFRKPQAPPPAQGPITIVMASDGAEDDSLRALRQGGEFDNPGPRKFEVYATPSTSLLAQPTWTPRSKAYRQAIDRLASLGIPTVAQLFDVLQGATTGLNTALIIPADVFDGYPSKAKRHFRPVAATSSIRDGRLTPKEYVFYPYNAAGLTITTEEELRRAVPAFNRDYLEPNREKLLNRFNIPAATWWQLSREREWQREPEPKLVSAYFGYRGRFAYDDTGESVVTQGYAWRWRKEASSDVEIDDPATFEENSSEGGTLPFHQSLLPWAYLALFNSEVFERFLSFVCPPMQGGQYNLSDRYVSRAFLPDLSDRGLLTTSTVTSLARLGRMIHAGKDADLGQLNQHVARAYQLSPQELGTTDA